MKRLVLSVFFVFLVAPLSFGQIVVNRRRLQSYGTTVSIFTIADRPAQISVNGVLAGRVVAQGSPWTATYGRQTWPFYDPNSYHPEFTVSAMLCSSLSTERVGVAPPKWTRDASQVGSDVLDQKFLVDASEKTLANRVKKIKALLDKKKVLGRGERKHELDEWIKFVKKHGLAVEREVCENPIKVDSYTIRAEPYGRAIALHIRQLKPGEEKYFIGP